jgi:hypothetical protein
MAKFAIDAHEIAIFAQGGENEKRREMGEVRIEA